MEAETTDEGTILQSYFICSNIYFKTEERKQNERAEEARRENEKNMVQSALGDKKSKLGVSFLYDMPNNIMPRGNSTTFDGSYSNVSIIYILFKVFKI